MSAMNVRHVPPSSHGISGSENLSSTSSVILSVFCLIIALCLSHRCKKAEIKVKNVNNVTRKNKKA